MRMIFLPILMATVTAAAAPALEDLDALDVRVAAAFSPGAVQPVDRRLRLLRCPEGVEIGPPALGAVTVTCVSKGWRVRLPVTAAAAAGSTLRGNVVIHRGDTIELAYNGSGFTIATSAVAVEDGRDGETVRVKTLTGASTVTVQVRGPGSASIGD